MELAIAMVVAAILSGSGTSLVVRNAVIKSLRQRLRVEVEEELGLSAQKQAEHEAAIEEMKLDKQIMAYDADKAAAERLAQENKKLELDNERRQLEIEAERQATVERELELVKRQEEDHARNQEIADSQAALLHEENERARIKQDALEADKQREEAKLQRQHDLEIEKQRADNVAKELEAERTRLEANRLHRQTIAEAFAAKAQLEQYRRCCAEEAARVRAEINFPAIRAMLAGRDLGLQVQTCAGKDLRIFDDDQLVKRTMTELMIELDMPLTDASGWDLVGMSKYPNIQQLLDSGSSSISSLQSRLRRADMNIMIFAHNHSDFIHWEMGLVVGSKLVLFSATEITRKPRCGEELAAIFAGLLAEMFEPLGLVNQQPGE